MRIPPWLQRLTVLPLWLLTPWAGGLTAAPLPLLSHGPVSNRVNIAVLSEGYTESQTTQFLIAATNAVRNLLSVPPLSDYSNHFNAVALFVASAQAGSDHPNIGQSVDTYFNSTYDPTSDYLISIPPNWANSNPADGQGKVEALLASEAPETDLAILLVNDLTEGGSDGGGGAVIAAANYPVILAHEAGHVLANLGDEYEWANPGYPDIEEPNTTRETNRAAIKWNAWIDTNIPVPTPETGAYAEAIGLFEGAHYHSTDWYRPKLNCGMRSYGVPFCEVCGEALVLSVYDHVRPVEGQSPSGSNVTLISESPVTFSVTLVQPLSHALEVQWFTNGVPVIGATLPSLNLDPSDLGPGTHPVRVDVEDSTPRVRTDPGQRLMQTVNWSVDVTLPWLRLDSTQWSPRGFVFRVTGAAPNGFVVETSTNLTTWMPGQNQQLLNGEAWFTNSSTAEPIQFYRAVTLP